MNELVQIKNLIYEIRGCKVMVDSDLADLYEIETKALNQAVKAVAKQPIMMKLSPNVTNIVEMAKAAEAGGSDALSLINTLTGMAIDINPLYNPLVNFHILYNFFFRL